MRDAVESRSLVVLGFLSQPNLLSSSQAFGVAALGNAVGWVERSDTQRVEDRVLTGSFWPVTGPGSTHDVVDSRTPAVLGFLRQPNLR
jgi:hypothetical protein